MVILKITFREHGRLFLGNMLPPGSLCSGVALHASNFILGNNPKIYLSGIGLLFFFSNLKCFSIIVLFP